MRRLAKTFRKDDYSSYKDYQKIISDSIVEYTFADETGNCLNFEVKSLISADDMVSFGGYVYPKDATKAKISLNDGQKRLFEYSQQLNRLWNRIGFCRSTSGRNCRECSN